MKFKHLFNSILYKVTRKQDTKSSFHDHDSDYATQTAFDHEVSVQREYDASHKMKTVGYAVLMKKLKSQRVVPKVAVDIGCGTGYFSEKFSHDFSQVISIEPSAAALGIARRCFPEKKYKNINWVEGFAEQQMPKVVPKKTCFFFTGTVLSHLPDDVVSGICAQVRRAPAGSVLLFDEGFGKEAHNYMWHVRTKEWWQEQLSGFELDFFGGPIQNVSGRFKGFNGVKRR